MNRLRQIISGLRFRTLLLVLVACAPLVALTLGTAWEERQRQLSNWQQEAQRLMELASREEEDLIGGTKQLLLAMAESSAVRTGNRRACKKLLDDLIATYPRYANLGLLATNGEIIATSLPLPATFSQLKQTFFKEALNTAAFSIGDFPIQKKDERPSIEFGHPTFGRSGKVQGVVFASVDLQSLDRFGSEIPAQTPQAATWTQVNSDGLILARFPGPAAWIGRTFPDPSLVNRAFGAPGEVVEGPGPQGKQAVYAFAPMKSRLSRATVMTVLSIPCEALFAESDRLLWRNLSWLGGAMGLALIFGWGGSNLLIVRPIKALVRSSARLAQGDLRTRTGLHHGRDELGQLTLAFDTMAQALEHRAQESQRANQKLQVLSHRLVEIQEAERRHIARELHDEIGQTLTAAEMNLQAALQAPMAPVLERRLQESYRAVEKVLEQVHDLSLNLRPSMLDDLGLEPALRWYTHRQADLAQLAMEFLPAHLDRRLPPIIETECFRIAQEALTNVVRHARASSVCVQLSQADEQLHLSVRDNGIGFDVDRVRERAVNGSSLGVLSMEERATLAGGELQILSTPGEGTEVRARFPLNSHSTTASVELYE